MAAWRGNSTSSTPWPPIRRGTSTRARWRPASGCRSSCGRINPHAAVNSDGSCWPPLYLLEAVLDAELHDARRAGLRRDAAERRRGKVQVRHVPVEVVGQVEDLHAQLQVLRGRDRHEPRDGEIDLPESRAVDAVAAVVAERPRG